MISDYSYFDVNQDTLNVAPGEAMQFGSALWHLLYRIHHANDRFRPLYMSKMDLSDDFYWLFLHPEDTYCFEVLFSTHTHKQNFITIPLCNLMEWVSSPPNFSACTKTITDLVNAGLADPQAFAVARQTPIHFDVISKSNPENDLVFSTTLV